MPNGGPACVRTAFMKPDRMAMDAILVELFTEPRCPGLVEIAWTDTESPFRLRNAKQFDCTNVHAAVVFAAHQNSEPGRNIYFGPGLRRPDIDPGRRAGDKEVIAASSVWTDHDDEVGFRTAIERATQIGIAPTLAVQTGSFPSLRGHLWWKLDSFCHDLQVHRTIERAMAQVLGGDPSVVNPSRLMRLPGSIAWPTKPGRRVELTKVYSGSSRSGAYYKIKDFDAVVAMSRQE